MGKKIPPAEPVGEKTVVGNLERMLAIESAIPPSWVVKAFRYNPATGELLWRHSHTSVKAGDIAGCIDNKRLGYVRVMFQGRRFLVHRLIWVYCYGVWPKTEIDHWDGDRANNRISNLRTCTCTVDNHQNIREAHVDNSTGLLGIYPCKQGFASRIQVDGNRIFLGTFAAPEEAHLVYLMAKRRLHDFCTI